MKLGREENEKHRGQRDEDDGAIRLEHLDRAMPVDRDRDTDSGDQDHEAERDGAIAAPEELGARLGGDDAVDREPADGEEKSERRAYIGASQPEDTAGEHDL